MHYTPAEGARAQTTHITTINLVQESTLPRVMPSSRQRLSEACQDVAKVLTQPSEQDVAYLSLLQACVKGVIQELLFCEYAAAKSYFVMRMVLKRCSL